MKEKENQHGRCYGNSFWEPILFPIGGYYDEFGKAENCNQHYQYIINALNNRTVGLPEDVSDITKIDEKTFFHLLLEQNLYINSSKKIENNLLDFVFLRKDIVDDIITNWGCQLYPMDDIIYYNTLISEIPNLLLIIKEIIDTEKSDFQQYSEISKQLLDSGLLTGRLVLNFQMLDYTEMFLKTRITLLELLKNNDYDGASLFLENIIFGKFIDLFMLSTRKIWVPSCFEGHQHDNMEPYKRLLDAMERSINHLK